MYDVNRGKRRDAWHGPVVVGLDAGRSLKIRIQSSSSSRPIGRADDRAVTRETGGLENGNYD